MNADLTPAMLAGTPVGGSGGFAVCDTCNRRLTDGHREHDPDDREADTVYAYATRVRGTSRWSLRWVSCEACGPPDDGDGAATTPAHGNSPCNRAIRAVSIGTWPTDTDADAADESAAQLDGIASSESAATVEADA